MQDNQAAHQDHLVKDGIILYKGHALILVEIALRSLLLTEFHYSLVSDRVSIQRT